MCDIIEHQFQKQENTNTKLVFADSKVYCDARVYAYYLYDLVEEINAHFWNNYQSANCELEQYHANEFDHLVKFVKTQIGDVLECLYNGEDNTTSYKMLKLGYDRDIVNLIEWLEKIGIPYRQAKIIDINNYTRINPNVKF